MKNTSRGCRGAAMSPPHQGNKVMLLFIWILVAVADKKYIGFGRYRCAELCSSPYRGVPPGGTTAASRRPPATESTVDYSHREGVAGIRPNQPTERHATHRHGCVVARTTDMNRSEYVYYDLNIEEISQSSTSVSINHQYF